MLLAIGDLLEEILIRLDAAPVRGADSAVRSARVRGGSAANVAALDAETGGTPRFVGQVGDDALGHALVDDLSSRGVDARVAHLGSTGVIVTTVGPLLIKLGRRSCGSRCLVTRAAVTRTSLRIPVLTLMITITKPRCTRLSCPCHPTILTHSWYNP